MTASSAPRPLIGMVLAVPLFVAGIAFPHAVSAATASPPPATADQVSTYANPVSQHVVDTFPDPTMIRGKDGAWYAYGTTNPIFNSKGEAGEHILPMLRSTDMVSWQYAGDAIAADVTPTWWPAGTRPWAPDIRYVDGTYHLTYSLSGGGVALLTSDHPTGPWTDHGLLVPTNNSGCPTGSIDQAMFTDSDGTHYLYWGSYDTICVSAMTPDATALTGPVTQVAQGRRAEGGLVVKRDGHYYLFFSDAGCCDGEFSGYTVKVGRADDPRGPFVNQEGQSLMDRRSKGGIVAAANGNGFVGPGHNAIQTDLSGQDWLVYHAIPADDPDFPPVSGGGGRLAALSKRPLMIDRLDWIEGWPVLRAGAGPSSGEQSAPVTQAAAGSNFNDGIPPEWVPAGAGVGRWTVTQVPDAQGVLSQAGSPTQPSLFVQAAPVSDDRRIEGDLRLPQAGDTGSVGLVISDRGPQNRVVAWLDRGRQALVVSVTDRGNTTETSAPLPASFDLGNWHTVSAELRGTSLSIDVSADRLREPQAVVRTLLPGTPAPGRIGAASLNAPGQADNISAAPLYQPVTKRVPDPVLGDLKPAYSDEFNAAGRPESSDPSWSWVRGTSATASETGGALTWSTQSADLYNANNTASVLLRDAPERDFAVETKLSFTGTNPAQQAGIVLYENDGRYLKLVHSVLPINRIPGAVTHQTEFGKEGERPTTTPPTPVFNGPMFGGPPAGTTWLRLAYHYDAARQEHYVRMASSTDGTHWVWGGTWSLPMRGKLRIGLVSMGGAGAIASFDYVRTYGLVSR
jgi:arabinan endo-1,5-alpha-L-arabinosidase